MKRKFKGRICWGLPVFMILLSHICLHTVHSTIRISGISTLILYSAYMCNHEYIYIYIYTTQKGFHAVDNLFNSLFHVKEHDVTGLDFTDHTVENLFKFFISGQRAWFYKSCQAKSICICRSTCFYIEVYACIYFRKIFELECTSSCVFVAKHNYFTIHVCTSHERSQHYPRVRLYPELNFAYTTTHARTFHKHNIELHTKATKNYTHISQTQQCNNTELQTYVLFKNAAHHTSIIFHTNTAFELIKRVHYTWRHKAGVVRMSPHQRRWPYSHRLRLLLGTCNYPPPPRDAKILLGYW
jgi:hypothetical protein